MSDKFYSDRIKAAAEAIGVPADGFEKSFVQLLGITESKDLDDEEVFKFGDFREAFKGTPVALLRKAFKALRGGKSEKPADENVSSDPRLNELRGLGFKTRIEDADPALLLKHYLPDKPNDPVANALKKRFGTKAVIAFRDDGTVAIEETLEYVSDLEQNLPERTTIMVDGKLTELWAIGAKPNSMVEEDPLFPGQPLRKGYSIINHRNWNEIEHSQRQLCRIIVERGDIDANNRDAVLRLLERAATKTGLQDAYPEAELQFRQLKTKDGLPKLKVELGSSTSKPNNPFGVKRSY